MKAPNLIPMLTYQDKTVTNALELFRQCADLPCRYWGFKDIGITKAKLKSLVEVMKASQKKVCLEVVSLKEKEALEAAHLAVEYQIDYLLGTVFHNRVSSFLQNKSVKYFPFCGKVEGHPSILKGKRADIINNAEELEKKAVDGLDVLAYRFIDNKEKLISNLLEKVKKPLVIAGSISNFDRINKLIKFKPWAFTIGTAFFEKKFKPDGTFRDQIMTVWEYLDKVK